LVAAAGLVTAGSASANTARSGQNMTEGHSTPPKGARATVRVGPVMVDCGGEAGVTLLVTHV
jgi:hypothetical protein